MANPEIYSDRRNGACLCVCDGCGQTFRQTHWRQRHCKPTCRAKALGRRRQSDVDVFTACVDAIEPTVFDN